MLTILTLSLPISACVAPKSSTTPAAEKKEPAKEGTTKKKVDPRSRFEFNEDGSVKTKTGKAEKTFNFPDLKVGFIFILPQLDFLPVLSIELYEFKKVPFYFDIGVSPHVMYLAIGYNILPIYEVGIFVWGGYHFLDRDKEFWGTNFHGACFGIGMTVLKF